MVLEYEIYLPLIIIELSKNILFNVNFYQEKIRLHPLDLLQLHISSYSLSAWHMKDLFLDRLISVRWGQLQLESQNLDMDTCVGNSSGCIFCSGNLSVSPSKRTGKRGPYMGRATGICHYGTREGFKGCYFVWRPFNTRAIWNTLPLTPFLLLVPSQHMPRI